MQKWLMNKEVKKLLLAYYSTLNKELSTGGAYTNKLKRIKKKIDSFDNVEILSTAKKLTKSKKRKPLKMLRMAININTYSG